MISPNDFHQQVIAEFRANGGKVGGPLAGRPMLLLTTTGAKSGQPRTNPLVYTTDGDRIIIIAAKSGGPTNPDWYHNLVANPVATVEIGAEKFRVRAAMAEGEERSRLYDQMAGQVSVFSEYQKKTTRQIPVVVLERAD